MKSDTSPETFILPPRPSTLPYAYSAVPDDPLPAVGDFWGVQRLDPIVVPAPIDRHAPAPLVRRRIVAPAPYVPVYIPVRKTAPVVSWAFTSALISMPLLILFGFGAVFGVLAAILGVVGLVQVNGSDHYKGSGRAAASIAIGLSTALVGTPVLMLTWAVLGML
ncbi:hypothetical protein HH308_02535 [Gordonia sp. TBRC 11910]|uniref:DUF4190 domain-containing protein n=1 Tax=Gordonia asplenii TaxID=2725283 RepID=A0A848KXA0_9ACTN|nr:DUF4190 domain-containing protein [Gordonia asplenii]NMO00088.1 hypothetical protein [Gordonia asplenii]